MATASRRRAMMCGVVVASVWLSATGAGVVAADFAPGPAVVEPVDGMQLPPASVSGGVGRVNGGVGAEERELSLPWAGNAGGPGELLQLVEPEPVVTSAQAERGSASVAIEHTPIVRPQPSGATVKLVSVDDEGDVVWEVWGAGLLVGVAALVLTVLIVRGPGR